MKLCSSCGIAPADSSRRNYCRACNRIYQRDWARRNRGSKPRLMPPRPLDPSEKWCPRCKRILSRDSFYKDRSRKDGLQDNCKGCEAFRQSAKYYKNHRRNKTKARIRSAAFRAKNPGYNARACLRYFYQQKHRKLDVVLGAAL